MNIWTVQESEEEGDERKKEHPLKLIQNSIKDHFEAYPNLNQTKVIIYRVSHETTVAKVFDFWYKLLHLFVNLILEVKF